MISRAVLVGALIFCTAEATLACRPVVGHRPFDPGREPATAAANVPPPEISVTRILRGTEAESEAGGSCSFLGGVYFDVPTSNAGYRFEIVEGHFVNDSPFPDASPFPNGFVRPRDQNPGVIWFIWADGAASTQEPIDVLVKVTAMSDAGEISEPLFLSIRHPGAP